MYNYLEAMKEDVMNYVKEESDYHDCDKIRDRESLEEYLNDHLRTEDSVTGNGSGSYTFNAYKAKEYVTDNADLLADMCREFCLEAAEVGQKFLDEEWEYFDVSIRCYLLGQAISEALDELEENGFFAEPENPFAEAAEAVSKTLVNGIAATI